MLDGEQLDVDIVLSACLREQRVDVGGRGCCGRGWMRGRIRQCVYGDDLGRGQVDVTAAVGVEEEADAAVGEWLLVGAVVAEAVAQRDALEGSRCRAESERGDRGEEQTTMESALKHWM